MSDSIRDRPKNEALTSRDEEPIVCTLGGAFLAFAIDESADHVCVTIPLPERASDMADALLAPFLPSNSIEGVPQNGTLSESTVRGGARQQFHRGRGSRSADEHAGRRHRKSKA
jgi:hypothetical protein